MSCGNCPNLEECKEFALNLNPDSDYKKLHPDLIRKVEQCMEKCKIDCAEWKSGGEEYYRDKLNEEIGKSLHAMRDIRTHIESVCKYQSEYLSSNIKCYCINNERRKMFVSELERLNGEPQLEPFVMDIRLRSDRARAIFEKFADEGYLEIIDGGRYKWLKNKLALSVFAEQTISRLRLRGKTWSVFSHLFIADFDTGQLQSYYKNHADIWDKNMHKIYETDPDCKRIRLIFAMNKF